MALAIHPAWSGTKVSARIKLKDETSEDGYLVLGSDDPSVITAYADGNGPILDADKRPRTGFNIDRIAENVWKATYSFADARNSKAEEDQKPGDLPKWSFDTGGGTIHVTNSRATTAYPPAVAPFPGPADFKGGINVREGSVEGVDVVSPNLRIQLEATFKHEFVTLAYIRKLAYLTGTVNKDEFKGLEPGEVLFLGASGRQDPNEGTWQITFSFEVNENENDLFVGGIGPIIKRGFDYLWVRYRDTDQHGMVVRIPVAVYVEEVYKFKSFDALGIG